MVVDSSHDYGHITVEKVRNMEFGTLGEAREFYAGYSRVKGFAIRKSKRVKNVKREVVRYNFVCNREGFKQRKWLAKFDIKWEYKPVTKCGCLAKLRIKRNAANGKWCIGRFLDDHNHTLLPRYL
ncbi:putative protein FAR1-RELATED SEQUENCE 10 [Arachis stenosperma]|uniref:putative protein FAR1-RELATED SEQUENCE 10 n=1 Tax=Arachis stenosperma TaxID=217475 RepID=UPI0025ABA91B|nr:putative protein FAR1-RELATED SEQUENCE 10 [Arachis stenosperma]